MMKKLSPIIPLLLILVSLTFAKNDTYQQLTLEGIDKAYNFQVEEATEIFNQIINLDPKNPHGYLLQAVNYFYRMQWEENNEAFEKEFKKLTSNAIKYSKKNLSNKEKRLDALFYLGTTNIYLAAYHIGKENWINAYRFGKGGINYLKDVIKIDPNYYDAYLGLGLFHYYVDVVPKLLKTLSYFLGFEGDREKGLRELKLAAEKGTYSKAEANFFLGRIYYYVEKEYSTAFDYARKLIQLYPSNPGFIIFLGECYQGVGMHKKAIFEFERALQHPAIEGYPFFEMFPHYSLAETYFELNDFEGAVAYYEKTVQLTKEKKDNFKWLYALANLKLGISYELLGKHEEAKQYYAKVRKSDQKKAFKEAKERLRKPLSDLDLSLIKGKNYVKTKDYNLAMATFEAALSDTKISTKKTDKERVPEILFQIAKTKFKQDQFKAARADFQNILQIKKIKTKWVKPWSHFYLGECYRQMGRLQEAVSEYESAKKFDDRGLRYQVEKRKKEIEKRLANKSNTR